MRKLLIAGAAVAALSLATPVMARDAGLIVGGTAGAWTGGTIGFLLGGPVGAIIGGSTGAAIGASVLSDDVDFGRSGDIEVGADVDYQVGDVVEGDIRLEAIRGEDQYGFFRANGNIYVVDVDTGEIVEIRAG